MKTEDLLLLAAVGAGGYLLWKHLSVSTVVVASTSTAGSPQPAAPGTPGTTPLSTQTQQPISTQGQPPITCPPGEIPTYGWENQPGCACPAGQIPAQMLNVLTPGSVNITQTGCVPASSLLTPGMKTFAQSLSIPKLGWTAGF